MATTTDYQRLRDDVGASYEALDNDEATKIFAEAAEICTSEATIKAQTRVIAIQRLLASSVKLTTYRQNNSSENLSDVSRNLKTLLDYWMAERDKAYLLETSAAGAGVVFFGRVRARTTCS